MKEIILADGISYTARELQSIKLLDIASGHNVQFREHEKRTGIFLHHLLTILPAGWKSNVPLVLDHVRTIANRVGRRLHRASVHH